MDLNAVRVEIIRHGYLATERLVYLRAQRHVAVLAVALSGAVTSVLAGVAAPAAAHPAGLVAALALGMVAVQVRALRKLAALLEERAAQATMAYHAVETLMVQGGERSVDAPADEGRA